MSAPKLSICIATLNRGAFIGQTLESIIAQATDEVEIVVVDGASTDNTPDVVEIYRRKFPQLNYVRLAQKGGVDADYNRTVELARGEYCWLMSDDDLLKPGAIPTVLRAVEKNYDLIIVNAEVRSNDFSRQIESKRLGLTDDLEYSPKDYEQFFRNTASYMSFIGCVVIRRQRWTEREREKFFGTEFVHIGVIFSSPMPGEVLVIAQPWIIIRGGNAAWTSRYFHIWMFKWPSLIWSLANYSTIAKRQVCPPEPWRLSKILLISRARGSYSVAEYAQWVAPRTLNWLDRWRPWIIARLPGCGVNFLVGLYFALKRPDQKYGLYEFRQSPFYWRNCMQNMFRRLTKTGMMLTRRK